jgi:hypothetical protein
MSIDAIFEALEAHMKCNERNPPVDTTPSHGQTDVFFLKVWRPSGYHPPQRPNAQHRLFCN